MNNVQQKSKRRSRPPGRDTRGQIQEALIGAAEATITRQGLSALRARDLALATGCAVGTIYNLFADLDGLILEVNARTLAALEARLDEVAGEQDAVGLPGQRLVALALAYLDFATLQRNRWAALFEHRFADPASMLPESYAAALARLFGHVEAPLVAIAGDVSADLARSVFSAIHGVVALGLSEKLATIPQDTLRAEVETVARALAHGLSGQQAGPETN